MRMTSTAPLLLLLLISAGLSFSCGSRPDIEYYQLALDQQILRGTDSGSDVALSVETMIADSAYEDPRMVYRKSPYRLDYYHYHRWTSPPGVLFSDFLRDAYEQSGYFSSVVAGFSPEAPVFLSGRVVSFEEVDVSPREWSARIKVNLLLRSAETGEVMWSRTITKEADVDDLTPEGVAAAMSEAATRIAAETAPEFAKLAVQAREKARRTETREKLLDNLQDGAVPEP